MREREVETMDIGKRWGLREVGRFKKSIEKFYVDSDFRVLPKILTILFKLGTH